jgi:hypothetical protein
MNPWVILAALLSLASSYLYGHHVGWTGRDDQARIELADANSASRSKEQELVGTINKQAFALRKANDEISKKQSRLSYLNAAGGLRLPAPSCVPAAESATPPAGDRAEAAGELERQTIEALIAIVADGDRAATQANACIDAYNEMKDKLNGDR